MAGTGSVGYNLNHVQIGTDDGSTVTWLDAPGSRSWEPGVSADSSDERADGQVYVTAYSSPVGEGDLVIIDMNSGVMAAVNATEVSSYGTAPDTITRAALAGNYVPEPFAIADWVPNIDGAHNPDVAGMRTIVPNATAQPATRSSGQESIVEWTVATKFTPSADNELIIYEWLASDPVFTDGVMPVDMTGTGV